MRRSRLMMALLAVALAPAFAWAVQTTARALTVEDAAITSSVEEREPVDRLGCATAPCSNSIPSDVGQLYHWTTIAGAEANSRVEHVWYRGDQEMARVSLRIGGSPWRTWSSKRIMPDWTGDWRVDVVADGSVIHTSHFRVVDAAVPGA